MMLHKSKTWILLMWAIAILNVNEVLASCNIRVQDVTCASRGLTEIPGNISQNAREINFENNNIKEVPGNIFQDLGSVIFLYAQSFNRDTSMMAIDYV
eukprot:m.254765 g.254765  ORF g.254765 m.254765 type:complete len:98 (-) comp16178_c0_seq2:1477-1770(-)